MSTSPLAAEIDRLRAALHWIRNEATFALQKFPGDVTSQRASLLDISARARASLEPSDAPHDRFTAYALASQAKRDALSDIAANQHADENFRRILSGGISDYGRPEHDMDTFGRPMKAGT